MAYAMKRLPQPAWKTVQQQSTETSEVRDDDGSWLCGAGGRDANTLTLITEGLQATLIRRTLSGNNNSPHLSSRFLIPEGLCLR
jgi:hypothetical protein